MNEWIFFTFVNFFQIWIVVELVNIFLQFGNNYWNSHTFVESTNSFGYLGRLIEVQKHFESETFFEFLNTFWTPRTIFYNRAHFMNTFTFFELANISWNLGTCFWIHEHFLNLKTFFEFWNNFLNSRTFFKFSFSRVLRIFLNWERY